MYQYQLYPTGNISNYKVMVNSISGVSAILDHKMAINENSLSGVALYIKAVNDYINIYNVGTTTNPIVSGFFNHIGFTNYSNDDRYPFRITQDGIISYVKNITTNNIYMYNKPYINSLHISGGAFNNSIFNNSFVENTEISEFIFNGIIQNIYSGNNNTNVTFYQIQPTITDKYTYPYSLSSNSGILNNITVGNNNYGLVDDMLYLDDRFFINNLSGINISGNLYINGIYKPNLSSYTSPTFGESLFNLQSHSHNGIDSSLVNFYNFKSQLPINDHFSLVQNSGDFNITDMYIGNEIGLYSNWEKVSITGITNVRQLITCRDKLYVLGDQKLNEVNIIDNTTTDVELESNDINPLFAIVATSDGDAPAIIEFNKNPDYTYTETIFNRPDDEQTIEQYVIVSISITDILYSTSTYHIQHNNLYEDGGELVYRIPVNSDSISRIGSKLYILFNEKFANDIQYNNLALYEIDTLKKYIKQVAYTKYLIRNERTYDGSISDLYISFLICSKPIIYKNSIHYFVNTLNNHYHTDYSGDTPSTEDYNTIANVMVYNTIYRPTSTITINDYYPSYPFIRVLPTQENTTLTRYGFNIYDNVNDTQFTNELANDGSYTIPFSYTYFNNKPIVAFGSKYFKFDSGSRNNINVTSIIYNPSLPTSSIISYAGKVWSGFCLENGRDSNDIDYKYPAFITQLKTILGNINTTPKLFKPIIYRGWLYAILPITYNTGNTIYGTTMIYGVNSYNDDIQPGALIVRRRAAESELVNSNAYTL